MTDRVESRAVDRFIEMQGELVDASFTKRSHLLTNPSGEFWKTINELPNDGIAEVVINDASTLGRNWQRDLSLANSHASNSLIYLEDKEQQLLEPGGSTVLVDDLGRTRAVLEVNDGLVYDVYEKLLGYRGLAKYGLRKAYLAFADSTAAMSSMFGASMGEDSLNTPNRLNMISRRLPNVYVSMGLAVAVLNKGAILGEMGVPHGVANTVLEPNTRGEQYVCVGQTGADLHRPLKSRCSKAAGTVLAILGSSPNLNDPQTLQLAEAASTELAGFADAIKARLIASYFASNDVSRSTAVCSYDLSPEYETLETLLAAH